MDLETIKSYDNGLWLEYLRQKTIFDVDNIKSHLDWLIEQSEKLEKLKNAYYANEFTVVDYLRTSSEVFEDKEIPTKKKRS